MGEHGRIISVYVDNWTEDVIERIATECGVTPEVFVEALVEEAAIRHSTIKEREERKGKA